ncbi:MAG: GNAT family N-acetyltransferase [Acidobacteria bacterium]|nr:GNAT family N-acetyltransferase [Acidobacteriota bacterium]
MNGAYVTLEPLDASRHGDALWEGAGGAAHEALWRYMGDGPFAGRAAFDACLEAKAVSVDPRFFALVDRATGRAEGHAALMRDEPRHRVIEVGHILYCGALQRTRGATEAMYLLARHVFEELGYRRYEWKCDALNEPSRKAALRLGFTFEGIFRQHMIVKGRNRDTAWFSMLDSEWPARKREFERWLAESNFDAAGRQLTPLAAARCGLPACTSPTAL